MINFSLILAAYGRRFVLKNFERKVIDIRVKISGKILKKSNIDKICIKKYMKKYFKEDPDKLKIFFKYIYYQNNEGSNT